jgi:pimeloyl-ACP methyl ester carboxylesterase
MRLARLTLLIGTIGQSSCSPTQWARGRMEHRFNHAGLTSSMVETDCCHVHSWHGGHGTPVMLLQGFGGDALVQWDRQVGPFAQQHQLLVPVLVFFGGSTSDDPRRSIDLQADAMLQLADHHGIDQFDVVGVSYGGLVAWWMAVTAPDRIRRLVLVDSPGTAFEPADLDQLMATHDVATPAELLLPAQPADLPRLIGLVEKRPPRLPEFILRDIYEQMFTSQVAEKHELLDELLALIGSTEALPAPVQPTLLVWGAADAVFPLPIAHRLQAILPRASQLVVIDGASHGPNVSHPDEFNGAVLPFLAD